MAEPNADIIATNTTVEVQNTPDILAATTDTASDASILSATPDIAVQNSVGSIEIQEIDGQGQILVTDPAVTVVESASDLIGLQTTVQNTQFLTTDPEVQYVDGTTEVLQVLYTGAQGPQGEPGGTTWAPVFAVGNGTAQQIILPVDCTIDDVIMFVEGVHQRDGFAIVGNVLTTTQPAGYNIVIYSNAAKPGSGTVGGTFAYQALTASTKWTINHNLNCNPSVTCVDSAGTQFWADVTYVSLNTIEVNFAYPMAGTAYLN